MFWWLWSTKKKLSALGVIVAAAAAVVLLTSGFPGSGSPSDDSPSSNGPDAPSSEVSGPPTSGNAIPPSTLSPDFAAAIDEKPTLAADSSRTVSLVLPRAFAPVLGGVPLDIVPTDDDAYALYVALEGNTDLETVVSVQESYLGFFGDVVTEEDGADRALLTVTGSDQGVDFTADIKIERFSTGIVITGLVRIDGEPEPLSQEELADLADTQWWNVWNAVATRLGVTAAILTPDEPGVTIP